MTKIFYLYTDGSYNPQLKHSTVGGYLKNQEGQMIFDFSESIHDKNILLFHELFAMNLGIKKALAHGVKHLVCFSDDLSIQNFNKLTYLTDHYKNIHKRKLMLEIMDMKQKFESIHFKHIKRKYNKFADKLAEKSQIDYFYHHLTFTEHFNLEDKKKLKVPNLICAENFYHQPIPMDEMHKIQNHILQASEKSDHHILCQIYTKDNKIAYLQMINKSFYQNNYVMYESSFDIKRVNAYALNAICDTLKMLINQQSIEQQMTLEIHTNHLALQKFEMVLRGKFIFPKLKTPLVDRFLQACSSFKHIILLGSYHADLEKQIKEEFILDNDQISRNAFYSKNMC